MKAWDGEERRKLRGLSDEEIDRIADRILEHSGRRLQLEIGKGSLRLGLRLLWAGCLALFGYFIGQWHK